jgi:hypothetical protein
VPSISVEEQNVVNVTAAGKMRSVDSLRLCEKTLLDINMPQECDGDKSLSWLVVVFVVPKLDNFK